MQFWGKPRLSKAKNFMILKYLTLNFIIFKNHKNDKVTSSMVNYVSFLHMLSMAIPVVKFSRVGYKIGKIFGKRSTVVNWNHWILQIYVMGSCQKVPKFDFQSQFCTSKIIWFFLIFLSCTNLGAIFLFFDIFDNITLLFKMMPNFWQLVTTIILKIQ